MTTPRPRAVVIGSLSLFVALFVVLTFELSASASSPAVKAQKTTKARPAPTETRTDAAAEPEEPVSEPVESEVPVVEYVPGIGYVERAPEAEYAEPEPEYAEPEVEEAPPVVTTSS